MGEILPRVAILYGCGGAEVLRQELDRAAMSADPRWVEEILDRYRRQMGDLPVFMKQLKQLFSVRYNHRKKRKGTLWEERNPSFRLGGRLLGFAILTIGRYPFPA